MENAIEEESEAEESKEDGIIRLEAIELKETNIDQE